MKPPTLFDEVFNENVLRIIYVRVFVVCLTNQPPPNSKSVVLFALVFFSVKIQQGRPRNYPVKYCTLYAHSVFNVNRPD